MEKIRQFFIEKKAAWLKDRGNLSATDEEKADERFALVNWLPDAATRASQLSMVSHPSKFSHPSAKTTAIIAKADYKADGYLRTGNLKYELDVYGNAAAMDVAKFLRLPMDDGRQILEHLEDDTPEVKRLLDIPTASYDDLKKGFLSVKQSDGNKTDRLVKQVYFPVADSKYHLLSLLTPSGVIFKLKNIIDGLKQASEARKSRKDNLPHEDGYDDILNLTVIGYGGTHPQNVSVLNNENAGRAYLLMGAPPSIEKRALRLPHHDFFSQSLRSCLFKGPMTDLHRFMRSDINNLKIRTAISNLIVYIVKMVVQEAEAIRNAETGWTSREHYQDIDKYQRIWLDSAYQDERLTQPDWLKGLSRQFSQWFMNTYKFILKADAITLSDHELLHVEGLIIDTLNTHEELLK